MNEQKPEARDRGDGSRIDLHSMFFTIQGEGPFAGHRAIFVRLAGCNLQCPGCDTEYTDGRESWLTRHLVIAIDDLAKRNGAAGCLVVVTGGEPFRQTLGPLLYALSAQGHHVQIESNGVFAPDDQSRDMIANGWATFVVSPKTKRINAEAAELATCFKYVLDHRSVDPHDGLPILALEHPAAGGVARPPFGNKKPVFLNPFDAKDDVRNACNLSAVADSCKRYGYILGVQLHKLAGLE